VVVVVVVLLGLLEPVKMAGLQTPHILAAVVAGGLMVERQE
jgi:hypothetical protein